MAEPQPNIGRKIRRIIDIGTILQAIFADLAGVIKTTEAGLNLVPIGALNNAVRITENTPIMVYNSDASVHFVAFGVQAMSAPSSAANGIPVLAGQTVVLNSGGEAWVRSDSSLVFGYVGDRPNG